MMKSFACSSVLIYFCTISVFINGAFGFDPFMDKELHKIEWVDKSGFEEDTVRCESLVYMNKGCFDNCREFPTIQSMLG